jgi:glycosyltransferase involved in cell wall biosynthesis
MRIGIDGRIVAYQQGGISTYVRELTLALAGLHCGDELFLFTGRKGEWPGGVPSGVISRPLLTPPHHQFEQQTLPLELRLASLDVFHSPDFVPPFGFNRPCVVTIHDLDFLRFPESKDADSLRYYGLVHRAVRAAQGVIAVSETTKRDMVELLDASPDRIDVVYHGVSAHYRPLEDTAAVELFCREHKVPERFILWVSTVEPRKNLSCALRALAAAELPADYGTLVIAGAKGWRADEELALIDELAALSL